MDIALELDDLAALKAQRTRPAGFKPTMRGRGPVAAAAPTAVPPTAPPAALPAVPPGAASDTPSQPNDALATAPRARLAPVAARRAPLAPAGVITSAAEPLPPLSVAVTSASPAGQRAVQPSSAPLTQPVLAATDESQADPSFNSQPTQSFVSAKHQAAQHPSDASASQPTQLQFPTDGPTQPLSRRRADDAQQKQQSQDAEVHPTQQQSLEANIELHITALPTRHSDPLLANAAPPATAGMGPSTAPSGAAQCIAPDSSVLDVLQQSAGVSPPPPVPDAASRPAQSASLQEPDSVLMAATPAAASVAPPVPTSYGGEQPASFSATASALPSRPTTTDRHHTPAQAVHAGPSLHSDATLSPSVAAATAGMAGSSSAWDAAAATAAAAVAGATVPASASVVIPAHLTNSIPTTAAAPASALPITARDASTSVPLTTAVAGGAAASPAMPPASVASPMRLQAPPRAPLPLPSQLLPINFRALGLPDRPATSAVGAGPSQQSRASPATLPGPALAAAAAASGDTAPAAADAAAAAMAGAQPLGASLNGGAGPSGSGPGLHPVVSSGAPAVLLRGSLRPPAKKKAPVDLQGFSVADLLAPPPSRVPPPKSSADPVAKKKRGRPKAQPVEVEQVSGDERPGTSVAAEAATAPSVSPRRRRDQALLAQRAAAVAESAARLAAAAMPSAAAAAAATLPLAPPSAQQQMLSQLATQARLRGMSAPSASPAGSSAAAAAATATAPSGPPASGGATTAGQAGDTGVPMPPPQSSPAPPFPPLQSAQQQAAGPVGSRTPAVRLGGVASSFRVAEAAGVAKRKAGRADAAGSAGAVEASLQGDSREADGTMSDNAAAAMLLAVSRGTPGKRTRRPTSRRIDELLGGDDAEEDVAPAPSRKRQGAAAKRLPAAADGGDGPALADAAAADEAAAPRRRGRARKQPPTPSGDDGSNTVPPVSDGGPSPDAPVRKRRRQPKGGGKKSVPPPESLSDACPAGATSDVPLDPSTALVTVTGPPRVGDADYYPAALSRSRRRDDGGTTSGGETSDGDGVSAGRRVSRRQQEDELYAAAGVPRFRLPLIDVNEVMDTGTWSLRKIIARVSLDDRRARDAEKRAAREEAAQRRLTGLTGAGGPCNTSQPSTSQSVVPASAPVSAHAPRMIMVDGQMVLDAGSLVVQAQQADVQQYERVEHSGLVNTWTHSRKTKTESWNPQATELFYRALRKYGTDFEKIAALYPKRTRLQIKRKFQRELKLHPQRVNDILYSTERQLDERDSQMLHDQIMSQIATAAATAAEDDDVGGDGGDGDGAAAGPADVAGCGAYGGTVPLTEMDAGGTRAAAASPPAGPSGSAGGDHAGGTRGGAASATGIAVADATAAAPRSRAVPRPNASAQRRVAAEQSTGAAKDSVATAAAADAPPAVQQDEGCQDAPQGFATYAEENEDDFQMY